ncbi:Mur ligase family protein [Nesterenkonia pannonica]|uniref:Mur ligase family protein n=1 Tax=Nesterenkonia pannonica TaxID=1548602 RepID=UPI002164448C|nr:Mur ligase family protein [Nesterenkonia pannonica]
MRVGDLFIAVRGARAHGADFIEEAYGAGAAAVVTDAAGVAKVREALGYSIPVIEVNRVRDAAGPAAGAVYGTTPTSDPSLFGVTGTNGKTTTTYFLRSLLSSLLAPQSRSTGLIGTIEIAAGLTPETSERIASDMTTPEAPALHGLMHRFRTENVAAAAMEVSSHSISYRRIAGLHFDVAGFTNLTQDHLDLHGTMEEYCAAKAKLFSQARTRTSVITVDDSWGHRMAAEAEGRVITLTTVSGPTEAHWSVGDVSSAGLGSAFTLENTLTGERIRTSTALPGRSTYPTRPWQRSWFWKPRPIPSGPRDSTGRTSSARWSRAVPSTSPSRDVCRSSARSKRPSSTSPTIRTP